MKIEEIKLTSFQLEELVFACEQNDNAISYFFDKETGELEMIADFMETDPELEERIEEQFGERYIRIPKIESWMSFEDMEEFIVTVQDNKIRASLEQALRGGRGVFGRFKDTLSKDLTEQWYKFKDLRNKDRVLKLFEEEELIKLIIE